MSTLLIRAEDWDRMVQSGRGGTSVAPSRLPTTPAARPRSLSGSLSEPARAWGAGPPAPASIEQAQTALSQAQA